MSSCRKDTNKKLPVLQLSFIHTCNTGNWNHSLRARNFIQPLKHVYIYIHLRYNFTFDTFLFQNSSRSGQTLREKNWKLEIGNLGE